MKRLTIVHALWGTVVCLFIACIIGAIRVNAKIDEFTQKSYNAWVKQTGNPNKLTQEEYRHLPKSCNCRHR